MTVEPKIDNEKNNLPLGTSQLVDPEHVDLPPGLDFTPVSAFDVMRANLTRVIVLAGPNESGKTTVINSIYELFQRGKMPGYLFAGSSTLPGFERRCHHDRIMSNAARADTPRTPYGEGNRFLHFRIRRENF